LAELGVSFEFEGKGEGVQRDDGQLEPPPVVDVGGTGLELEEGGSGGSDEAKLGVVGVTVALPPRVGMIIERGRLKKCVVICTRAGRKYVPISAQTITTSLSTFAISCTNERPSTVPNNNVFDIGIVVVCLIRSGMGKGGVVMMIEGMPRRRVIADRAWMNGPRR
jgi:hypothetical protein